MLELQSKAKRQIEMLGLALTNSEALRDSDFAVLFKRDVPTVKRDLRELRGLGIDVHSEKNKGICVSGHIGAGMLRELITQYLSMCNPGSGIDRATAILVQKQKERALSNVVTLQRCIEGTRVARIDYQKDDSAVERGREVSPILIFSSDGHWRLLAVNEAKIKQYLLAKILALRTTSRKFTRVPQEQIDSMFRYSFKSWVGAEQHRVTIHLSKIWADRVKPRQLMTTEEITEREDGSIIVEAVVNSLEEVASWIVTRGEGVTVIEPEELKRKVIVLAKGALANYGLAEIYARRTS